MTGKEFGSISILTIIFLFLIIPGLSAQSDTTAGAAGNSAAQPPVFEPLPSGYGGIELGMDIDTVKQNLLSNPDFNYRGDPDVTMLPQGKSRVIDCDGTFFIDRAYFQFSEDRLYLITLVLDEEYIDHYSVYSALCGKYGDPSSLNPSRTLWQNDKLSISLERPLSIKYTDLEVFRRIVDSSNAETSLQQQLRQDFLDSF